MSVDEAMKEDTHRMAIERLEKGQQVDRAGVVLYSLFGNRGNGTEESSFLGRSVPTEPKLPGPGRLTKSPSAG